jgi:hypothetical protein
VLIQTARWNLGEMQENFARRGLPAPDEGMTRERWLGKGAEVPNLVTLKDFFRFQASTMRGKITKKVKESTDDSLNSFGDCFFAGFIRVTGTEVGKAERSEVYKVGLVTNSFGRYTF